MLRPSLCFLASFLALVGSAACDIGPEALSWRVRFACAEAASDVEAVELSIVEGGCEGDNVRYRVRRKRDATAPVDPPTLPKGRYGFRAEALDAEGKVRASGCDPLELPAEVSVEVVMDGPACDALSLDGGRDGDAGGGPGTMRDAAAPEAGRDASDSGRPDRDGDGIADDVDRAPDDEFACADADSDGCDDCQVRGEADVSRDGPDQGADGACDCVFFVRASQKNDAGDGTWWPRAYKTLQVAIDAAEDAVDPLRSIDRCEVWVAAGTYSVNTGFRTDSLQMRASVDIFGGFAGDEESRSTRDIKAHVTTLSGRGAGGVDPVYHVVDAASDAILDGFTIRDGRADGSANLGRGGGVYANGKSPEIRNCTFEDNTAAYGGGMYVEGAAPIISGCLFQSNTATGQGGAIYAEDAQPTILQTYFSSNAAVSGGALALLGNSATKVENCAFWSNTVSQVGGATLDQGTSQSSYWNCSFVDNTAPQGGHDAAVNDTATQTFYNSILQGPTPSEQRWFRIGNNGTVAMSYCVSSGAQIPASGYTVTAPITGTASFEDRALGKLRLTAGSIGIDGSFPNANTPSVDLEGKAAVGIRDVGAYEFGN